ncbi:GNAT family N-acetyltransferase [Candidatus Thorarchaeota archaeon]|nr:MAG: GNAT family N-acetyltransferase [Candidatus Thorarchaeota archaeon]
MFEIIVQRLSDIDIAELAKFTFETLQSSVFRVENRTTAEIEQSLNERADDENELVVLAREQESREILGKLGIYTGFPRMVFISKWDPIVMQSKKRDAVARTLIKRCKKYTRHIGFNRLEASLSPINENNEKLRSDYQILYEREGFHKATEEASMRVEMSKWIPELQSSKLPEGYQFEEVGDRTDAEVYEVFHETFKLSKDRLHLDMAPSEQQTTFKHWFDRTRPFHATSLFVVKDNKIVGFSIGRANDNIVYLGPFGLLPEHRGNGVAQALLHEGLMRIKADKDIKYAELEVDVDNPSAVKLYTRFGFTQQYRQEYYSWNVPR